VIDVEAELTAAEVEMVCAEVNSSLRLPVSRALVGAPCHVLLLQGPDAIRLVKT
jgi:hypothetical protein